MGLRLRERTCHRLPCGRCSECPGLAATIASGQTVTALNTPHTASQTWLQTPRFNPHIAPYRRCLFPRAMLALFSSTRHSGANFSYAPWRR